MYNENSLKRDEKVQLRYEGDVDVRETTLFLQDRVGMEIERAEMVRRASKKQLSLDFFFFRGAIALQINTKGKTVFARINFNKHRR